MIDWEAREKSNRDGAGLLVEAMGYANAMPEDTDENVLQWAREYLPRMREWAAARDKLHYA